MKKKTKVSKRKKVFKGLGCVLLCLVLAVVAYFAYVFIDYKRLPDKMQLTPVQNGDYAFFEKQGNVKVNTAYRVMTYNIGFGAYTADYSFFMDGGKSSWAKDKESLIANICSISEVINLSDVDFLMLQEVDLDGTRSYHENELELLNQNVWDYYYVFAQNYDSPFLMYPLLEPHGKNKSCQVTYSKFEISDAIRRSFPISESVSKLVDLDRCYSITRIPVEGGKKLCLYNVHMSAYTSDVNVREGQVNMLFEDMKLDYALGNYVICGGDFNHNLRTTASVNVPDWAQPFPREKLPENFKMAMDGAADEFIAHDTCRNANEPYDPATAFTVAVDGFIVSNNVEVNYYQHADWQYAYSDHDPVIMEFFLR